MAGPKLQNQGYRQDLNLQETLSDFDAWNSLYETGIGLDLAVIRNNLRNTSPIGFSSIHNDFFEFSSDGEFIFTDNDTVGLSHTVSFASTTLDYGTNYYVVNSDGRNRFKLSTRPKTHVLGVSTISEVSGDPIGVTSPDSGPLDPFPADPTGTFNIVRKDPVHQTNILNFINPDNQDDTFSYVAGSLNSAFLNTSVNNEVAEFLLTKKYRNDKDTITDREVKYEGSIIVNDPDNRNNTGTGVNDIPNSPGIFIGETRAFSTDNNPWTKETADSAVQTESDEVSIGELFFNDEIEIVGVTTETVTSVPDNPSLKVGNYPAGKLYKIPIVINNETYYVLLDQAT